MNAPQELFNILFTLSGALGGWCLKVIWSTMSELQKSEKEMMDKVSRIEILVAGSYVKREDYQKTMERLFEKLDALHERTLK